MKNKLDFIEKKNLSEITTIGVGGPARYYVEVATVPEAAEALLFAKEHALPFLVVGRGSNMLCSDEGFDGLVIHNKIAFLEKLDEGERLTLRVGGGYQFSLLGSQTARWGYGGLEFASGIPASVGGAVFMNAGANGSETCDALVEVEWLDEAGQHHRYRRDQLQFQYRCSPFHAMKGMVVAATFLLNSAPEARKKQMEIIAQRKATQPLKDRSAGCIFRNPEGGHSGALIDQAGLKGLKVGGAQVSNLHANFIVNKEGASSDDIKKLIALIQEKVKEETGHHLESEVRTIPFKTEGP